jgi:hypothetical protein
MTMSHAHDLTHHQHGPSATASVVLDIGGSIGALILQADATRLGEEIEISRHTPDGEPPAPRTHSMVRERRTDPPSYDAVYPDLHAGDYTVWADPVTPVGTFSITGGAITRFRLS